MEITGTPEQQAALFMALAEAQGDFDKIAKDRTVKIATASGGYTYDYATLDAVLDATRPHLARRGVATLMPHWRDGDRVTCVFLVTGHGATIKLTSSWRQIELAFDREGVPIREEDGRQREWPLDVKQAAAEVTYHQRYVYSKFFNLSSDADADDGPVAARGETTAQAAPRQPAQGSGKPAAQHPAGKPRSAVSPERTAVWKALNVELGYATPQALEICSKLVPKKALGDFTDEDMGLVIEYLQAQKLGREAEEKRAKEAAQGGTVTPKGAQS